MADTAETEEEPTKQGGGVTRLITAAMISAALITTGYLIGGRGSGTTSAAPTETTELVEEEPSVGHVIDLDAVNVNLAEGHYLRIAVSLGLSEEVELHDPEEFASAPASDLVVATFSGRTLEDLSTSDGRVKVRHELEQGLHDYYGEEIVAVFFTEFVMQ